MSRGAKGTGPLVLVTAGLWLAAAAAGASLEGTDDVLALFAGLEERYVVEGVEEAAGERIVRLRSSEAIGRGVDGALYQRASVTISSPPEGDAAEAVRRRLAAADPEIGLSYAWDFVIAAERRVLHLHAGCTLSEAAFERVAEALARAARSGGSGDPPSFWCRCGAGCRPGAPFGTDRRAASRLPPVRRDDPTAAEDEAYDNRLDPSGSWTSAIGELSLMHHADALSFTYTAVFGPTAHLCEGAGVAGLVGRDRYEHLDDQGTVAFAVAEDGVRMEVVDGIASFCGAGWAADRFAVETYEPPADCLVSAERTAFRVVDAVDPERRPAWVEAGHRVAAVPAHLSSEQRWALARHAGAERTTVGLLAREALECPGIRW